MGAMTVGPGGDGSIMVGGTPTGAVEQVVTDIHQNFRSLRCLNLGYGRLEHITLVMVLNQQGGPGGDGGSGGGGNGTWFGRSSSPKSNGGGGHGGHRRWRWRWWIHIIRWWWWW